MKDKWLLDIREVAQFESADYPQVDHNKWFPLREIEQTMSAFSACRSPGMAGATH